LRSFPWLQEGLGQDSRRLTEYIEALGKAPFAELGRNEKLAMRINAYNAFTLKPLTPTKSGSLIGNRSKRLGLLMTC
jgi:hypothetical protein